MLESVPEIKVVGYATDGEEGIRKVLDLRPDLVTLDLEMPRMDGFTLLRIIMNSCPTPVIVISSRNDDERVFKALELGAVDFVAKPSRTISEDLLNIHDDLIAKVRTTFSLNLSSITARPAVKALPVAAPEMKRGTVVLSDTLSSVDVVAIGASTGGPPALQGMLNSLGARLPFCVVISQHMPAGFTRTFAERLNRLSSLEVKEAQDGDVLLPGKAFVAPGGYNMVFQRREDSVVVRIVKPAAEDRFVPSVDAMFSSCAELFGRRLLGVVLTGMGNDGRRGVVSIKNAGGQILAESEQTAVVYGMPREAVATGMVDRIVPLDGMAREILLRSGIFPETR
jgi:two-component system chemotaxis response regulator CheB